MAMLSLANIRKLVETDLDDTALNIVATSEYNDLIARYGDDGERTIQLPGGHQDLVISLPVVTIASIKEINHYDGTVSELTLASDDYIMLYGGRLLKRVASGANPARSWAPLVSVTYTPASREYLRNRVHCDLIKLALQFNGTREEWFGDYRTKFGSSYHTTREQVMRQLANNRGMILA